MPVIFVHARKKNGHKGLHYETLMFANWTFCIDFLFVVQGFMPVFFGGARKKDGHKGLHYDPFMVSFLSSTFHLLPSGLH